MNSNISIQDKSDINIINKNLKELATKSSYNKIKKPRNTLINMLIYRESNPSDIALYPYINLFILFLNPHYFCFTIYTKICSVKFNSNKIIS